MSFDLFGFGPRRLPNNDAGNYSDGPDRKRGPGKCRGQTADPCYGTGRTPHDHSCCCDPCRHKFMDTCQGGSCCKCVPKAICAVFTPNTPSGGCKQRTWRAEAVQVNGRAFYDFPVPDNGLISLSVGTDPVGYGGVCNWKLEATALDIEETVPIDHSGEVHCQAPPTFVIENINVKYYPVDASPVDCFGTLTFTENTEAKIPFRYQWEGQETHVDGLDCGDCVRMCAVLCVKRGRVGEADYTRVNFVWDNTSELWQADDNSGHYITLTEVYGQCYFRLDSITPVTFLNDLIEITECAEGMDLTAVDEDENYIRISCNPCSCWKYKCGGLRCVCKQLCAIGVQDGVLSGPFSLSWDYDAQRWGNDYFSVTPFRDSYGNCRVSVTGFSDSVPLVGDGGKIGFGIAESVEDQLESGLTNSFSFRCQNCDGDCSSGTCLSICDDVPNILYAEVSPAPWTEMLGCQPPEGCFATITFPLAQSFVSTVLNPAGEYRWQGCGIIACKNCLSATVTNHLVCIDLGCDGLGTFTLIPPGGSGGTPMPISVAIPCNTGVPLDVEIEVDTGGPLCCDEGGFIVRITE